MKPRLFLIAALIALFSSCSNEVILNNDKGSDNLSDGYLVSIEEAQADLESLLEDLDVFSTRSSKRSIASSYTLSSQLGTRSSDSTEYSLHIFNFDDNCGYAIMSGDKRIPSLLALTEEGNLMPEDTVSNPGVDVFLECLDLMFSGIEGGRVPFEPYDPDLDPIGPGTGGGGGYTYGKWENEVFVQSGLCQVKWHQDSPYNVLCPLDNGEFSLAGCVPVSIAQLMSIYGWPQQYKGYTFDWGKMTSTRGKSLVGQSGQYDIAYLMKVLGLPENLNVSYSKDASGAESVNSVRTLLNFGYSNGGVFGDYNEQTIVSDLEDCYPILLTGYSFKKTKKILGITISTSHSGGHQWLVHGLLERRRDVFYNNSFLKKEIQYYLLCNWGWGEGYDGYFLSGAFDSNNGKVYDDDESTTRSDDYVEEGVKRNYRYKLRCITGIRP